VLEEHTAAGEVSRVYTYGNGPLSQQQLINGQWQTSYYGRDTHGSVRYLTDATGQVTDNYDYDAFGNVINQSGNTPNTRLFSGEEFDPDLGMEYLRARYRDPQRGRFWTRDSFEGDLADPASRHGYNYCQNNPVNAIDPSGHETLMEVGMAENVAALMGSALQNLFVGTMSDVYALQENAPAKANSQAEAMMIQSTQQGVGVAGGLQNYWNVMNGVPFLLAANPFVAPTPALTLAPTVLGFDAAEPIYGAGLRHAVMEAGYPNASGMIDPTWTLNSGLAVTPAAQRAHEMNFDPQGAETQLAGEINEQSPALAANLAKSLNEANLSASDNRALQILELPKGGIAGPGIEPVALGVIGYTPAAWEPGALKADPLCSDQLMHALFDAPQTLWEEGRATGLGLWHSDTRSQTAVSLMYGAGHGAFNVFMDVEHALNHIAGGAVSVADKVSGVSLSAALGYNVKDTDTVLNGAMNWGNQQLGQAATFYGGDAGSQAAKFGEILPMLIPFDRVVAVAGRGAEALGEGIAIAARGDQIIPGALRSVEKSNVGRSLVEAEAESLDAGKVASKQVEKMVPEGSTTVASAAPGNGLKIRINPRAGELGGINISGANAAEGGMWEQTVDEVNYAGAQTRKFTTRMPEETEALRVEFEKEVRPVYLKLFAENARPAQLQRFSQEEIALLQRGKV
ncbi:MAG TPA: RHS repeat-associated core domain-containing protein, partial [Verrucomicrobiae bacterium]